MTEFGDWLQNNAIDLMRLAIESVFLVMMVKFSRTLLRTLRASQEQLGALLRLSVSDSGERSSGAGESYQRPLSAPEPEPAFVAEREPVFAPMAPAPSYSSGSILGPINGGNGGGENGGNGGVYSGPASPESGQRLGGGGTSGPPGRAWPNFPGGYGGGALPHS